MYKKLGILFSLLFAVASVNAADGSTKPAVQARQAMEARNAETYSQTMTAADAASHYAYGKVAEGKTEYIKVAQACADCADMAGVAAKFSARGSPMAEMAGEALAKCCDMTAQEAEKLNDPALAMCIEHCKRAATQARELQKAQ